MSHGSHLSAALAAVAAAALAAQANASLILDTGITSAFNHQLTTTGTSGNDLPGRPSTLYFGQLEATADGFVDFFFLGNEAGYVNSLLVGGTVVHTTAGIADHFNAPYGQKGSIGVGAGQAVEFGFCTSGGSDVGGFGRCVDNANAASLTAQFNFGGNDGYRSIAYRPLTSFDPLTSARTYGTGTGASDLWMIFWDDSGARNDDDHDDYIAVTRFRPAPARVPEPATALLLGAGLLGVAAGGRTRRTVRA